MSPYHEDPAVTLYHGDCRELLAELPRSSIDAIVTDPPYGLEFMGKEWDKLRNRGQAEPGRYHNDTNFLAPGDRIRYRAGQEAQAFHESWARAALRVLKPGGHLLAFGGSRTYHRLACAVEDAGFEIRDQVLWLYGSGFPKSLDVSKSIDRAAGAERQVIGRKAVTKETGGRGLDFAADGAPSGQRAGFVPITAPATEDARRWNGWGTALKPAHEPIIVARRALEGTVAENVLKFGTGAMNIDACRVECAERPLIEKRSGPDVPQHLYGEGLSPGSRFMGTTDQGRWPANVVHDGSAEVLDGFPRCEGEGSDSAARFFYSAKADAADRGGRANHHPTVKPVDLMRWLVRLVTPPGGLVLDPFSGSGTTLVAAKYSGFRAIGIEREAAYCKIAAGRLAQEVLPFVTGAAERRRQIAALREKEATS